MSVVKPFFKKSSNPENSPISNGTYEEVYFLSKIEIRCSHLKFPEQILTVGESHLIPEHEHKPQSFHRLLNLFCQRGL